MFPVENLSPSVKDPVNKFTISSGWSMALTATTAHARNSANFTIMLEFQSQTERFQQAVKFEHLAVELEFGGMQTKGLM